MFMSLNEDQIKSKLKFIDQYVHANNSADGSKLDANANVSQKNIATLQYELNKDVFIQVNRSLMCQKITELFGNDLALEYIRQLDAHEIYKNDETSLNPYCVSISMYPFLLNGLKDLSGESKAPTNLDSFCGSFINLIFAISAQFSGAVAAVEFFAYFNYFAEKQFGLDYLKSHSKEIDQYFQQIVYTLNQPAMARGYQSVFFNVSCYDQYYFESLFENFIFPDGNSPNYLNIKRLQEYFLTWFNHERTKAVLTFPVVTCAMLIQDGKPRDSDFEQMCASQLAKGNSFFIYQSDSADSLASCCRLRNAIEDNTFSYTLGAGGVATGSIGVMTLNYNRLVQDGRDLKEEIIKIQKYLYAYRKIVEEFYENGMLPVYNAGFISLHKQYVTIGINGFVEGCQYQGYEISNNDKYLQFAQEQLKLIADLNKEFKQKYNVLINTEMVPAENVGVKFAQWDRDAGYQTFRDCYNSYFYIVEDELTNLVDKFVMHGQEVTKYLDGGSAAHINLEEKMTQKQYVKLIRISAKTGCSYFCINVKTTICNKCNHIDKKTMYYCNSCGSKDVDHATRIIGYLKRVSAWSTARQKEHQLRFYHRLAIK